MRAGVAGMKPAATRPKTANTTQAAAAAVCPMSGMATNMPPTMLPSRMATKVPISTMPLPPTSSRSCSTSGK